MFQVQNVQRYNRFLMLVTLYEVVVEESKLKIHFYEEIKRIELLLFLMLFVLLHVQRILIFLHAKYQVIQ